MNKSVKILQILFFLFIGSMGAQMAFAQTSAVWNGTVNTAWYTNNPLANEFTITTAEQLAGLRQLVNSGTNFRNKTIKLGANIALNNTTNWQNWASSPPARTWVPIGTNTNRFNGTFDGVGFTVQGVYINRGVNVDIANDNQGLFGSIGEDGIIKNLGVISSYIKGCGAIGGIAGNNYGTITNSYSSGVMLTGRWRLGGLVGVNSGNIISSYSTGTVEGFDGNAGGLVGLNIGGIRTSYSTGSLEGDSHIGGFVGTNSGTISDSYSIGAVKCGVTPGPRAYCGGFAGALYDGKIHNCYSTGKITDAASWFKSNIGGFIGENENVNLVKFFEKFGEFFGAEPGKKIGNAVGTWVAGTSVINNSYYDIQTSERSKAIGSGTASNRVTGKSTADMKRQTTFATWDFNRTWGINSTRNNGYPHLRDFYIASSSSGSSSSSASSSSSSSIPSYHIFAYHGKEAENTPTIYGGYIHAYTYNGATASNPKDEYSDGILGFSDGVAKLWNVELNPVSDSYSGAVISMHNETTGIPNIAECEKISYYYKGDPHWFLLEFEKDLCANPTLADDNKWGLAVTPAQNTWTKRTVDLTTLGLARSWQGAGCGGATGNVNAVHVDLKKVTNISWAFDDNINGSKQNLMIANVACLTTSGGAIADTAPPEDITVTNGWPIPSYHIFAYQGKNAEFNTTAYGGYMTSFVYNGAIANNPENKDIAGLLGFVEGVAKLRDVTLADPDKYSGAGINIDNKTLGKPNIADCNEISYYYKGDPHWFLVEFQKNLCDDPALADDNKWGLEVTPAQNGWTKKTIDLTTLKMPRSWQGAGCGGEDGNTGAVPVDLAKATKISWVFDDNVNNGTSKNLMIANVACLTPRGGAIADSAPPEDITVTSGWQSSSSSSGTDTPSSSSVTPSSSSSDGGTPIRLPQIATANQATQIRNGINLQATNNAMVEVFNLKGNLIGRQNFKGGVYVVSFGHLPKGMYIIKTSFGSEKQILRVPVR
ncbi:MAG: T9SS type A sorting domain-containing protein [Fibromonadaceae bacterium]|jgi:hypothetical protein|nr:T9SS type A sorting domain-containing protein [Fibromonadaceae bacterium]